MTSLQERLDEMTRLETSLSDTLRRCSTEKQKLLRLLERERNRSEHWRTRAQAAEAELAQLRGGGNA